MKTSELFTMKVLRLRELGGRLGVSLKARMKKAEIVESLLNALGNTPVADIPPETSADETPPPASQPGSPADEAEEECPRYMEAGKFYAGAPHHGQTREIPEELPSGYGDNVVTLLVRDPCWAYAYWEVTPKALEAARASLGGAGASSFPALRLYDVTGVDFDGTNANSRFDTSVSERIGDWYINTARPGRSFIADIGLMTRQGRFVTLARSNSISMPPDRVSDVLDEQWVIGEEEFMRLFALSGGYGAGGSSADVRMPAGGRLPFGMASPGMGSMALMSPMKGHERGFWFTLNTELIVYGATEPDAKVSVQGRPVGLRPDGTFTLRFALPDGRQVIPVSATSGDEVETRWITPEVSRDTTF